MQNSAFEVNEVVSDLLECPTYFAEVSCLEHDPRYEVSYGINTLMVTNLVTKKTCVLKAILDQEGEIVSWEYNHIGPLELQDLKIVVVND